MKGLCGNEEEADCFMGASLKCSIPWDGRSILQMREPGVRPVLGRCSVAAAREAESIVSFSSIFWLRWEENVA